MPETTTTTTTAPRDAFWSRSANMATVAASVAPFVMLLIGWSAGMSFEVHDLKAAAARQLEIDAVQDKKLEKLHETDQALGALLSELRASQAVTQSDVRWIRDTLAEQRGQLR